MSRDGIFKRKSAFYISFIDATGRRRQLKTSAPTLTQARDIRNAKLAEAEKQRVLGYAPPTKDTFTDFSAEYLKHQKTRITPMAYERSRGIVETHLKTAFGPMRLAAIRRKDIENYISTRSEAKVKPGTIIKEFNVLKHLLTVAVRRELIPVNHARDVRPPKAPAGREKYLSMEEALLILAHSPAWLRPIVLLLLATGMRRGELLGMQWRHVDMGHNRIFLPKTKNGHSRTVQLNELASTVLAAIPRKQPTDYVFPESEQVSPVNISLAFLRACRRAGVTDCRLHDLRHTCASHLAMRGANIQAVGKVLGHRDPRMTARYSHLSPDYLQQTVKLLDEVFPAGFADHLPVTIEHINRSEPLQTGAKLLTTEVMEESIA
jgi:integrase